ncbi:MAG: hypothetical protein K8T26_08660 [Lentisphaerae bacterium]|nr:hypothetical protein [Lentisphaerota bacterium]
MRTIAWLAAAITVSLRTLDTYGLDFRSDGLPTTARIATSYLGRVESEYRAIVLHYDTDLTYDADAEIQEEAISLWPAFAPAVEKSGLPLAAIMAHIKPENLPHAGWSPQAVHFQKRTNAWVLLRMMTTFSTTSPVSRVMSTVGADTSVAVTSEPQYLQAATNAAIRNARGPRQTEMYEILPMADEQRRVLRAQHKGKDLLYDPREFEERKPTPEGPTTDIEVVIE